MIEINDRLDRAERELGRLGLELAELRELTGQEVAPGTLAEPEPAPAPLEPPPAQVAWTPPPWPPAAPRPQRPKREIDLAALFGPSALAWAGGLVTLLGVVFVFALAANRGWIGPVERTLLGGVVSALLFTVGLLGRRRYGNLYAAVAAVGSGIAGGYVTSLVAAARYDLLEALPALAVALAIAVVGTVAALRWRSETVAAIGLVGGLLVPLVTLFEGGVTPLGTGFALLVLIGACIVGVRMGWQALLAAASWCGLMEIGLLVLDEGEGASGRVLALVAAYAAVLLGTGLARGVARDRLGRSLALASAALTGLSLPALLNGQWLGLDAQGAALVVAALFYVGVAAVLFVRARDRDAAALVGALGLSLGGVGAAYLLDGPALVIAWSAQTVVLAWLAGRVGDARIGIGALAYLGLAAGHALALDAPLEQLVEPVSRPVDGVTAVLAVAAASSCFAWLVGRWPVLEPAGGAVARAIAELVRPRAELRLVTAALAAAAALYALGLGILELVGDFGWGHVVVIATWGVIGLVILAAGVAGRRVELRLGGLAVLGLALVDLAAVQRELASTESGAAGLVAAAALVVAALLHERVRSVGPVALAVPLAGALALWAAAQIWHDQELGLAMVAIAVPLGLLAAFRARLRDLSTLLWGTALAVSLAAPALVAGGTLAVLAWTLGAAVLAGLGAELGERRLIAAACTPLGIALGWTLILLAPVRDLLMAGGSPGEGVWAVALCAGALLAAGFALGRLGDEPEDGFDRLVEQAVAGRDRLWVLAGGLGLYGLSLAALALVTALGSAGADTEFQRGHTAVSTLWGVVALALVLAGLRRGARSARVAGLVLLTVTLAKIFLFDLARLDSVTRALSFLAVGAVLLLAGFFTQRLSISER